MPDDDVTEWIDRVRQEDSEAAYRLWQRYFEHLVRAVRKHLQGQNRAVSDEEDVVASVFESFYDAAKQGRFPDLKDRDDLWQLLLKMASRKAIDKRRHDQRQRRGAGIQVHSLNRPAGQEGPAESRLDPQIVDDQPTPEMIAMVAETLNQLFSQLAVGDLKEIAVAKLEGYSNAEIARRLRCSERTIERRLHLIREKCNRGLMAHDEDSTGEASDRGVGEN